MKVSVIGAGLMGKGIVKNLLAAGYAVSITQHKTRETVDALITLGATEAASNADLIREGDVILTCLPTLSAVNAVFTGQGGVQELARPGTLVIDCSTSDPTNTRNLAGELAASDIALVDAPLLGGPPQAWDGVMGIVAGGESQAVERARPLLDAISGALFVAGGPGAGHTVKLINNAVTLTNSAILYETFAVAQRMNVDQETLYKVLDASMASSKRLHVIAPALINDDHAKNFAVSAATKDMKLYDLLAHSSGILSVLGSSSRQLHEIVNGMGYGDENVTRITTALMKLAQENDAQS